MSSGALICVIPSICPFSMGCVANTPYPCMSECFISRLSGKGLYATTIRPVSYMCFGMRVHVLLQYAHDLVSPTFSL